MHTQVKKPESKAKEIRKYFHTLDYELMITSAKRKRISDYIISSSEE
jgi:hypothetical protein